VRPWGEEPGKTVLSEYSKERQGETYLDIFRKILSGVPAGKNGILKNIARVDIIVYVGKKPFNIGNLGIGGQKFPPISFDPCRRQCGSRDPEDTDSFEPAAQLHAYRKPGYLGIPNQSTKLFGPPLLST